VSRCRVPRLEHTEPRGIAADGCRGTEAELLDTSAALHAGACPERGARGAATVGVEATLDFLAAFFKARLELVEVRLEVWNLLHKRLKFNRFYC